MIRSLIESRFYLILSFFCLSVLGYLSYGVVSSYDLFWHIATAREFYEHGLSPFVDQYTYVYFQEPIGAMIFGFQSVIYFFVDLFGFHLGHFLFRFLCSGSCIGIWLYYCKKQNLPIWVSLSSSSLILFALIIRLFSRPETLSYPIELGFLLLSLSVVDQSKLNTKKSAALLGILWVWSFLHVSVVMGYITLGALGFHQFLRFKHQRWHWGLVGTLSVLLGFLNPTLTHPLKSVLSMNPDWGFFILEMKPISLFEQSEIHRAGWVLFGVFWFSFWLRRFWFGLVLLGVLLFGAFQYTKAFPHLVILSIPVLVFYLSDLLKDQNQFVWFQKNRLKLKKIVAATGVIIFSVIVHRVWGRAPYVGSFHERLPVGVVQKIKDLGFKGRILNEHAAGGYLTYRFGKEAKIYIDGRTNILFPYEHLSHYSIAGYRPELFSELLDLTFDQEKMTPVVMVFQLKQGLDHHVQRALESDAFEVFYEEKGWALLIPSGRYQDFRPNNAKSRFPLSSILFREPRCLKDVQGSHSLKRQMKKEFKIANEVLPNRSQFGLMIEFVNGYLNAKNKKQYLNLKLGAWAMSRPILRMGAMLADQMGDPKLSQSFNAAIYKKYHVDQNRELELILKTQNQDLIYDAITRLSFSIESRKQDYLKSIELINKYKPKADQKKAIEGITDSLQKRVSKAASYDFREYCTRSTQKLKESLPD